MKLIIAGGRDFANYDLLVREVDKIALINPISAVISGMARGADSLGARWANDSEVKLIEMPADWNQYGRSAGYKRNEQMAAIADMCICFWDGQSRGTKHMIDIAQRQNIPLAVVRY